MNAKLLLQVITCLLRNHFQRIWFETCCFFPKRCRYYTILNWVRRTRESKGIPTSIFELTKSDSIIHRGRHFNINMIWRTKSVALFNSLIVSPRIHVRRTAAGPLLTFYIIALYNWKFSIRHKGCQLVSILPLIPPKIGKISFLGKWHYFFPFC